MTKHIQSLIPDVQALLTTRGWFDEFETDTSREVGTRLSQQFGKTERAPTLRLSQMGPRCPRALWYSIHQPDQAEPLPPWAEFKYAFGHIIEALAVTLAKAAGHEITGEQDELTLDGIHGHRDCIIDGAVVDVKSCSSRAFQKYKTGMVAHDDSFGYLDQLDGYVVASATDPLVRIKDRGYLLAIDKQLGHMCLYEHFIREESIRERIRNYRAIVALPEPPQCTCETIPDGKSGNIRLGVTASYNSYKYACWPQLRTFLYSDGPRYLTKVVKYPVNQFGPITEVDRYGKIIYN